MIEQPLDHFNTTDKIFKQRILVGFNSKTAPTVLEAEGYAIGNSSPPTFMKGCNYISVEHRYFGKSVPDSLDWTYLTIKQACYDLHHIRELFGQLFTGTWLTTGISKGGQTAIAYKMFFPNNADATLLYVTPIKNSINDNRLQTTQNQLPTQSVAKRFSPSNSLHLETKGHCLLILTNTYKIKATLSEKLESEKVFEYLLLEYPFAFYQNCFACSLIPDTTALSSEIVAEIVSGGFSQAFFRRFQTKTRTFILYVLSRTWLLRV